MKNKTNTFITIEAIYYLLNKLGKKTNKLKIIKLIYLADKYHLLRYGRTITGDKYYAMDYGPVASLVKDILSYDKLDLFQDEFKYVTKLIEKIDDNNFEAKIKLKDNAIDMLSETDKEAIDYVIEHFGRFSHSHLIDYTHKYPEWKKHEQSLKSGVFRRQQIPTTELCSVIDDKFPVTKEQVSISKEIVTGCFD